MKDEGVTGIFVQGVVKNLKKKKNEDNFEFLDVFDKDEFHCTLRRLAQNFMVSKTAVSSS